MKPTMDVLSTEVLHHQCNIYLCLNVSSKVGTYKRWQLQVVKLLETIHQKSDIAVNQTTFCTIQVM